MLAQAASATQARVDSDVATRSRADRLPAVGRDSVVVADLSTLDSAAGDLEATGIAATVTGATATVAMVAAMVTAAMVVTATATAVTGITAMVDGVMGVAGVTDTVWGYGWGSGWGGDDWWLLDDLFGLALNFTSVALNPWSPFATLGADLLGDGVQALGNLDNNNGYGNYDGNYDDQGSYGGGYSNDPGYYDNSGYTYPPYRQPYQPLCGTDYSSENPGCVQ